MLILTEKPSVAKSFAVALGIPFLKDAGYFEGKDVTITNCVGHLYQLAKPEEYDKRYKHWSFDNLPIIPEHYLYTEDPSAKKQIKIVKQLLKSHSKDKIIIATDADREGEVIARIVFTQAGLYDISNCYRFWVSEALTPDVIKAGLSKVEPWKKYNILSVQGFARQHADWLVGMNLSPYATIIGGHKETFPVGRVQTAILAAIAQRNNEVKNFVKEPYYQCMATLTDSTGSSIYANLINPKTKKNFFLNKQDEYLLAAQSFSNSNKNITIKTDVKRKTANPPKLLSLTQLQKLASSYYDYSSKKTLDIAQKLYEEYKCMSYPRTPSDVLGDDDVQLFLSKFNLLKNKYEISTFCNPSLITQDNKHIFNSAKLESHHALIPLDFLPDRATDAERNIYNLVLNHFFLCCCDKFIYDEKTLTISNGNYEYNSTIKNVVSKGYKKPEELYLSKNKKEDDDLITFNELDCNLIKTEIVEKFTTPKKEFTETSLLSFMENPTSQNTDEKLVGLGTPATRADILLKLETHGYVFKEKKKYYATAKGYSLLDLLFQNPLTAKIASISQTTQWEKELESAPIDFERRIVEYIYDCMSNHPNIKIAEKKIIGTCPICQGKLLETEKNVFCENINSKDNKCSFEIWKNICGCTLNFDDIQALINGQQTSLKKMKSKTGKAFNSYVTLNTNTWKTELVFQNNFKK